MTATNDPKETPKNTTGQTSIKSLQDIKSTIAKLPPVFKYGCFASCGGCLLVIFGLIVFGLILDNTDWGKKLEAEQKKDREEWKKAHPETSNNASNSDKEAYRKGYECGSLVCGKPTLEKELTAASFNKIIADMPSGEKSMAISGFRDGMNGNSSKY